MFEQIVNNQVTTLRDEVYVKLVDEGLDVGVAGDFSANFDLEEVLASA